MTRMPSAREGKMLTLTVHHDRVIGWNWSVTAGPADGPAAWLHVEVDWGWAFSRTAALRAGRRAVARRTRMITSRYEEAVDVTDAV